METRHGAAARTTDLNLHERKPLLKSPSWSLLIGLALTLIAVALGTTLYRVGALKGVAIERGTDGPHRLVAREHLGPYHGISDVISAVEAWAKEHGEPCAQAFGEYFDDPNTTDSDRLRSRGGCILSNDAIARLAESGGLPEGTTVSELPSREALIAVFEGAPSIGPLKVYPKVFDEMKRLELRLNGPIFEIYEAHVEDARAGEASPTAGLTRYVFPVESAR